MLPSFHVTYLLYTLACCVGAGLCTLPYAGQFALRAHDPSDNVASAAPRISSFFMKYRFRFAFNSE